MNTNKKYFANDVVKFIRPFLKENFPNCKFSVRRDGLSSIYIALTFADFVPFTDQTMKHIELNSGRDILNNSKLSSAAKEVFLKVRDFTQSYNWDNGDPYTDYSDYNFILYLSVGKWDKPFVFSPRAAQTTKPAAACVSPEATQEDEPTSEAPTASYGDSERSQNLEKYTMALLDYLAGGGTSSWDLDKLFRIPDSKISEASDLMGEMNRDYNDVECDEEGLSTEQDEEIDKILNDYAIKLLQLSDYEPTSEAPTASYADSERSQDLNHENKYNNMKQYNLTTLSAQNQNFLNTHTLRESDVNSVNALIKQVAKFHKSHNTPQVGDIVEGAYYNGTHEYDSGIIERIETDETTNKTTVTICTNGSAYLCEAKAYRMKISVSGGIFITHDIAELEIVSENEERTMWHFGSCGACANGGVYFDVPVKRWRIPYTWNAKHTLVDVVDKRDNERDVYISLDGMFRLRSFSSVEEAKKFLDYVGVKYKPIEDRFGFASWSLSHNFVECSPGGFWSLDEIPNDAKPIKLMNNGSFVDGFFRITEREIVIYRPNPNAKEVYKPMDWNEKIEYCKHNVHM